ncbi:MAG: Long-chain acyl-CoA synthetase [Amycolatopsis sp.]|jgi:long-chain acyl-CoA synthetase|uniref:class I adenylate-forming enzyme family protein n=1 Tax=Amycolatopsis sp. TaxID=37632 RepID=UPI002626423D|nr:AMP-binding protein [Amycolatopsis sp.]MCU1680338.1 Long-chain acyl-CoA synthetase [Amycolatopsis sp.]
MTTTAGVSPADFPVSFDYPAVPVGSILAGAAARYGDRTAFAHGERSLGFAETYIAACRFANALRADGIGRGDVVSIHLPNCLAYPVAYYGILLAGATFSPANPLLPADDLVAQLTDCGAVAVVTFGPLSATLTSVLADTPVRRVVVVSPVAELTESQVEFEAFHGDQPDTRPDVEIDVLADLAHISYTGGTTGRSKGVCLPHRNIVVNSLQSTCRSGSVPVLDARGDLTIEQIGDEREWPGRIGSGVAVTLTPWFHAMGIIGGLNVPVLSGTTLVLADRFDPVRYLADAERWQVTTIGGAPALYAALLACPDFATRDLSSVRGVSSGAAPLAHEVITRLQARFPGVPIIEGYGMTEMTMGAVVSPTHLSGVRKVGSVGLPIPDTEIKIVPVDGGEDAIPPNTEGEVCLRGPQMMTGYLNRPQETAAALVDGWLHTGDIGLLDDDGYLFIVDRKKDMLLYKGYNVYPRELEELLLAQPGVLGAAVVGRPQADVGELPVAFVVTAPGHTVDAEKLVAAVNAKVLPYKRLRELRFVERIPVSAAGKILKRELRDRL